MSIERFQMVEGFSGWDLMPSDTGDYCEYRKEFEELTTLRQTVAQLKSRLSKWEDWKPADETLAELKKQADDKSLAAKTAYYCALEFHLQHAEQNIAAKDAEIARLQSDLNALKPHPKCDGGCMFACKMETEALIATKDAEIESYKRAIAAEYEKREALDAEIERLNKLVLNLQKERGESCEKQQAIIAATVMAAEDVCNMDDLGEPHPESTQGKIKSYIRNLTPADAKAKLREMLIASHCNAQEFHNGAGVFSLQLAERYADEVLK